MTDTANAPERIKAWMQPYFSEIGSWSTTRYPEVTIEYVLSTHCDELVAAADEEAFARGANWAQEKARVEGRLVIVDSPELATLRADLAEAQAKIARLTMIANELSWSKKTRDISNRLFAALQENAHG